ncbi:hypothetical protein EON82_20810 [bacterium]|nr:MAG: hypothetical protein EON82_20810 [bacterium]
MLVEIQGLGTKWDGPVDDAGVADLSLDVAEDAPLGKSSLIVIVRDAGGRAIGKRTTSVTVAEESPAGKGGVHFTVAWPPLNRGVLDRADTLSIVLTDADGATHEESISRPNTEVSISDLPAGPYQVTVEALQDDVAIGRGEYTDGVIHEGETDEADVSLEELLGGVKITIGDSE